MLNWRFKIGFLTLVAALVAVTSAAHYRRSHPQVRCAIPDRDYQFKRFSQPARSISAPSILLRGPGVELVDGVRPPHPPRAVKSFQFVQNPRLQIDHCTLSQMNVQVQATGDWTVSFRADQNPVPNPVLDREPNVTTSQQIQLFTEHLQRNQFYVTVICYARNDVPQSNELLGHPIVIPLEMKPFWVQRRQPYLFFATGNHGRLADFFDQVDRVEIEFKYRTE